VTGILVHPNLCAVRLPNPLFSLNYQPVVHAGKDRVIGYEALIRWSSPTRGSIPPADFIPFAEEHDMTVEIGDWVLRTACAEAAGWTEDLTISINISLRHSSAREALPSGSRAC